MTCAACRQSMPDLGHTTCFSCVAGSDASRSSEGASEAYRKGLAARGARKPRETATAPASVRAGSPRRRQLPTARELRERGLDTYERGERRTRAEEVIRSVMLT